LHTACHLGKSNNALSDAAVALLAQQLVVSHETDFSHTFHHNFIDPILNVKFGHDGPRFVAKELVACKKRILYPAAENRHFLITDIVWDFLKKRFPANR